MTDDLIKWLREAANRHNNYRCDEAADRIETLEKALREVISVSDRKTDIYDRAKAALGEKKE